jgi:hypothetical protein
MEWLDSSGRRPVGALATHRCVTSGHDANSAPPGDTPQEATRELGEFAVVGGLGTITNLVLFYGLVDAAALVGALAGAAITAGCLSSRT